MVDLPADKDILQDPAFSRVEILRAHSHQGAGAERRNTAAWSCAWPWEQYNSHWGDQLTRHGLIHQLLVQIYVCCDKPKLLRSGNGKNFVGIKRAQARDQLMEPRKGTRHSQQASGGCSGASTLPWECQIRTVKRVLAGLIREEVTTRCWSPSSLSQRGWWTIIIL